MAIQFSPTTQIASELSVEGVRSDIAQQTRTEVGLALSVSTPKNSPEPIPIEKLKTGFIAEAKLGVTSGKNDSVSETTADGSTEVFLYTDDTHYLSPSNEQTTLKTVGVTGEVFVGLRSFIGERWSFDVGPQFKYMKALNGSQTVFSGSYGPVDLAREISAGMMARVHYRFNDVVSFSLGGDMMTGNRVGFNDSGVKVSNRFYGFGAFAGVSLDLSSLSREREPIKKEEPNPPLQAPEVTAPTQPVPAPITPEEPTPSPQAPEAPKIVPQVVVSPKRKMSDEEILNLFPPATQTSLTSWLQTPENENKTLLDALLAINPPLPHVDHDAQVDAHFLIQQDGNLASKPEETSAEKEYKEKLVNFLLQIIDGAYQTQGDTKSYSQAEIATAVFNPDPYEDMVSWSESQVGWENPRWIKLDYGHMATLRNAAYLRESFYKSLFVLEDEGIVTQLVDESVVIPQEAAPITPEVIVKKPEKTIHHNDDGSVKITFANGDVYEGFAEDGMPHGFGKMTYSLNRHVYEGQWQYGLKEGKGRYTFTGNGFYEGRWHNDLRHGYGVFEYDGFSYKGWYEGDLAHGLAVAKHPDGRIERGYWQYGVLKKGQGKSATEKL